MQIHELNDYNGNLGSNAFVAIDDGMDTGKKSIAGLLAKVNSDLADLDTSLNARIDNIIAGDPAPSASEIIDARQGADGVTYSSLGAAIRGQYTVLLDEIEALATTTLLNGYDKDSLEDTNGYYSNNDGNFVANANYVACYRYARVKPNTKYSFWYGNGSAGIYNYVIWYDATNTFISGSVLPSSNIITSPANAFYVRICPQATRQNVVFCEGETYPGYNSFGYEIMLDSDVTLPEFDSVLEQLQKFNYTESESVGYMGADGQIRSSETAFHNLTTNVIECKEGDSFYYTGHGEFGAYSWVTYLDGILVSAGKIKGSGSVVIPSGVNQIKFSSYAEVNKIVTLRIDRTNPITLADQVEKNKENIQANPLENIKIDIIGDSLSAVNATASDKYTNLLADNEMADVNVLAASGRGYFNGTSENSDQFYKQANNVRTNADVVFIFGSFNDISKIVEGSTSIGSESDVNTTTICGCINTTINNILARNPAAKILFSTPTPWSGYTPDNSGNNVNNGTALQYVQAIKDVCNYRGYPVIDLFRCSNLKPWIESIRTAYFYEADGTHPNNAGHLKYLYPVIKNYISQFV